MRVAFLFNSARIIGGGEIGFAELIRRARQEPDIEPLVLVPGEGEVGDLLTRRDIPWQTVSMPSLRRAGVLFWPWRSLRRLALPLRRAGIDLIHANGARCMLYAGLAGRMIARPVLWHVRVLERDRFLDRLRARLAAKIVCNSRAVCASLEFARGARDKSTVVYNGVEQEPFRRAKPANLHAEFGIPPERRVFVCAALLVPWKGQQDLIEALALLPDDVRSRLQLFFAGRELTPGQPFSRALRDRAAALGVADQITWAGHRRDLPRIFRAADALVLPSRGEPFGRVIVEAWAANLPVIACNAGGAAEIIEHGKTGWLAAPASPRDLARGLRLLLENPDLAQRLAEAGHRRAADFTLKKHAAAIFEVYRSMTSAPGAYSPARPPPD